MNLPVEGQLYNDSRIPVDAQIAQCLNVYSSLFCIDDERVPHFNPIVGTSILSDVCLFQEEFIAALLNKNKKGSWFR